MKVVILENRLSGSSWAFIINQVYVFWIKYKNKNTGISLVEGDDGGVKNRGKIGENHDV